MVVITGTYTGGFRVEMRHNPSGAVLATDPPVDNKGRGESFSPTDLLATALGSCMLTLMGMTASAMHVDIDGTTVYVEKHIAPDLPRRVGRLAIKIVVHGVVQEEQLKKLEHAAMTCPVKYSIHPDIQLDVEFSTLASEVS